MVGLRLGAGGCTWSRCGELNTRVRGNHLGDAGCDLQQGIAVVTAAHERNHFALKAAHLAIGQNRLQSVSGLNARTVILDRVKNQNAAVSGLAADPPLLEEINSIRLNVAAIQRIDGHHGDLGMSVVIDLPTDVLHLSDCLRLKNVGEVVNVAGWMELRYLLRVSRNANEYNKQEGERQLRTRTHGQILQDRSCTGKRRRALVGIPAPTDAARCRGGAASCQGPNPARARRTVLSYPRLRLSISSASWFSSATVLKCVALLILWISHADDT